jgi:hypothetical protein
MQNCCKLFGWGGQELCGHAERPGASAVSGCAGRRNRSSLDNVSRAIPARCASSGCVSVATRRQVSNPRKNVAPIPGGRGGYGLPLVKPFLNRPRVRSTSSARGSGVSTTRSTRAIMGYGNDPCILGPFAASAARWRYAASELYRLATPIAVGGEGPVVGNCRPPRRRRGAVAANGRGHGRSAR